MESDHQQSIDEDARSLKEEGESVEEATADEETHRHITDDEEEGGGGGEAAREAQRASSHFLDEREEEEDNDMHLEAKESETPVSYTEAVEEKNQTALDRSSSRSSAVVGDGDRLLPESQPSVVSPSAAAAERESFAARYLGSVRLPEGDLIGEKGLNAMTQCIANVTSKKSNKVIYELKENKKVNLALEGREMKVIGDDREAKLVLCHPLNKIRAWAVGRQVDSRHFAYVIRSADDAAGYWFVCRVFKCNTEARHVTSALRTICQRRADARSALKKAL